MATYLLLSSQGLLPYRGQFQRGRSWKRRQEVSSQCLQGLTCEIPLCDLGDVEAYGSYQWAHLTDWLSSTL